MLRDLMQAASAPLFRGCVAVFAVLIAVAMARAIVHGPQSIFEAEFLSSLTRYLVRVMLPLLAAYVVCSMIFANRNRS